VCVKNDPVFLKKKVDTPLLSHFLPEGKQLNETVSRWICPSNNIAKNQGNFAKAARQRVTFNSEVSVTKGIKFGVISERS
jgi:hypothetical protein